MGKRFNPQVFARPPEKLSVVPNHGESWSDKWANWWAGATIASPTTPMVAPAAWALKTVRELYGSARDLDEFYVERTEWARETARDVLSLPRSAPIILDASGTSAILIATRILAHAAKLAGRKELLTITTNEGGSLVPSTLKGKDPNDIDLVMFQPGTMLFYEPSPVLPYPDGLSLSYSSISIQDFGNEAFVAELGRLIEEASDKAVCVMLPHVVKTGRILPIREVGDLVARFKAAGRTVHLVIDDVQGIGRTEAEAVANPLSFADAYLFGASKALGALLIASVTAIREEHLALFVDKVKDAAAKGDALPAANVPWLSHYQFAPEIEAQLPERIFKESALSLPEIVSMSAALQHHFTRGEGRSFSERRLNQLSLVLKKRQRLVEGLLSIAGAVVLEPEDDKPIVPSIVSLRLERRGPCEWLSPAALKRQLQETRPIITPAAPIGRWIRFDIPEYREMPSVDLLVSKIRTIYGA